LEPPATEFWPELIARVKAAHPHLVFIAEAYWDMEWTLQQQGFDYCYDKRLYDRLAHEGPESVRAHLGAGLDYQNRLVRFIENHDEPRARATFGPGRERAAAVAALTLPGARLIHDGQLDGFREHIPVFVDRGPRETPDPELRAFYERLLSVELDGDWRLCECSDPRLVAWAWDEHLVVVNLSDVEAQGAVRHPWPGRQTFSDRLSGTVYEREGDELYVILAPWASHLLHWSPG
jgi:hypothetical protein